jgi:hypothetical protein
MWLSFTHSNKPFDFKYKVTRMIAAKELTNIPAKVYHPNSVENQCVSMLLIKSQAEVDDVTA